LLTANTFGDSPALMAQVAHESMRSGVHQICGVDKEAALSRQKQKVWGASVFENHSVLLVRSRSTKENEADFQERSRWNATSISP
jgi:hypothetical protein